MAISSDEGVGGEETPQVSLSGLQRLSTRNTSSYDRHGNRVSRSGTVDVSAPTPAPKQTNRPEQKRKIESKGALPEKRRSGKRSSNSDTFQPLRDVSPAAEERAVNVLAQDLRVAPADAKELLRRYEVVRRNSMKIPLEQRRETALRVMKLSSQDYDQFLRAWLRYVENRKIVPKSHQVDSGERKIALAMNVKVQIVQMWRKRIDAIIEESRLGNDYLHFDRVAVQMRLSTVQLKKLIAIDPAIAKAMQTVFVPKPQPKVTRVPTQSHTNLKEPKRAPGVRGAGLSDFESKDQCPSCGVVTDINGACSCR